jgi:hypothetical protein
MPHKPYANIVRPRVERVEPYLARGVGVDGQLQSGNLVVGKLMAREDAERKLENIWAEMNKEASSEAAF